MEHLMTFAMNHPLLVGSFMALLTMLLMLENRRSGQSLSSQQVTHLANQGALLVDLREPKEFREGHITGSINIPYSQLPTRLADLEPGRSKPVILICKLGQSAGAAGRLLTRAGFPEVRRLSGGITAWKSDGLPLIKKG